VFYKNTWSTRPAQKMHPFLSIMRVPQKRTSSASQAGPRRSPGWRSELPLCWRPHVTPRAPKKKSYTKRPIRRASKSAIDSERNEALAEGVVVAVKRKHVINCLPGNVI